MKGFVTVVENVLDERAKHAIMLIEAVEECTDMAILAEGALSALRGLRGGIHTPHLHEKEPRCSSANRFVAPPDSIPQVVRRNQALDQSRVV